MDAIEFDPRSGQYDDHIGELALALAKAQAAFPSITRSREVTVTTKAGGSYSFKYAPLDSIFAAIRKPLADNDLAVTQLLDGSSLTTLLLHGSGAVLTSRVPIVSGSGIQEFGSAITYLRRYALQAILGIAADDDDDGNAAAGNRVMSGKQVPPVGVDVASPIVHREEITGILSIGTSNQSDGRLRETPDGWALGFNLTTGPRAWVRVLLLDDLALAIAQDNRDLRPGLPLKVYGPVERAEDHVGDRIVRYQRVTAERVTADEWEYPSASAPEAASLPLFGDVEAELDAALT